MTDNKHEKRRDTKSSRMTKMPQRGLDRSPRRDSERRSTHKNRNRADTISDERFKITSGKTGDRKRTSNADRKKISETNHSSRYRSKRFNPNLESMKENAFREKLEKHQRKKKVEKENYLKEIANQIASGIGEDEVLRKIEERKRKRMKLFKDQVKVEDVPEATKGIPTVPDDSQRSNSGALDSEVEQEKPSVNADFSQESKKLKAIPGSKAIKDIFDLSEDNVDSVDVGNSNADTDYKNKVGSETRDFGIIDDSDGFFIFRAGEVMNGRYKALGFQGKGVFSSVFLILDTKTNEKKSIKIIRRNDVMRKTGQRETQLLEALRKKDPLGKKHTVRYFESFEHKGHLCLVFEALSLNLRQLLRKCGSVGLNIAAVRSYSVQLLTALQFLKSGDLVHADVKPDNVLVGEKRSVMKLCDFGSAFSTKNCSVTPYLCSRYYRPPEIVLGCDYSQPVDMWSFGCLVAEIYSGKILFKGETNNEMLHLFMQFFGRFPKKMMRRGAFVPDHFNENQVFMLNRIDSVTGAEYKKQMTITKPEKILMNALHPSGSQQFEEMSEEEKKPVRLFKDLVEKCLRLDPSKRLTPVQALQHPFITAKS